MSNRPPRSSWFERSFTTFALFVVAFLSFPTALIIPMSFGDDTYLRFPPRGFTMQWYIEYFSDRDWLAATWFSLKVAIATAVVSLALGTAAAISLSRPHMMGRSFIRIILTGPIILPQIVIAIALLLFFQNLNMLGSVFAFVAAHTCLALPYVVFSIASSLAQYNQSLDAAALVCGAGRWTIIRRITLPIIRPGLLSGGLFAFLISFDEAVVSFFLSSLTDKTLPRKFFEDIQLNVSPVLTAVATLLTALTVIVLATMALLKRREARSFE